jgi:hypothetical protein
MADQLVEACAKEEGGIKCVLTIPSAALFIH